MLKFVFYPVNALFSTAPFLFWSLAIVALFYLAYFTYKTFRRIQEDVEWVEDRWSVDLLIDRHFRRVVANVILTFGFIYLLGGSLTSVAPRAVIATRPSANGEYLKRIDALDTTTTAGKRARRSESPSWKELSDRTKKSEKEQDERIENARK